MEGSQRTCRAGQPLGVGCCQLRRMPLERETAGAELGVA